MKQKRLSAGKKQLANSKKKEIMLGGQAVIEGVMMRTQTTYAVAVRSEKGKIISMRNDFESATRKNKILGLPFVRGMIVLYETLLLGIKALNYSANIAMGEEEPKKKTGKKNSGGGWESAITLVISMIFAIGLFKLLPLLAATYIGPIFGGSNLAFNITDGVAKFAILISYLLIISFHPDVKRLFQYHGAEHMAVACHEKKKQLTVDNVMKCHKEHPRCGTSFIIFVLFLSIIFYMFIPVGVSFWQKLGIRILMLPVIAGVSYELIRLAGKYDNILMRTLTLPGILVQKITTQKPDKKQVEVAIKSLEEALK